MVSLQNEKVKLWKKLKTRKWRDREQMYLLEGPHLLGEAIHWAPGELSAVLIDEGFHPSPEWPLEQFDVYQVTHKIFTELSQTESPQGIIGICQMRRPTFSIRKGRYLLVDGVQDPGNLGTLIRTADAFGLDAVLLGDGCTDCFNSKTLRAAQGSHFHLEVVRRELLSVVNAMKEIGIPIFGSSLDGNDLCRMRRSMPYFGLVVGNEGGGVSPKLLEASDVRVRIPMSGRAESLNVAVAAGILLFRLQEDRLASDA
jgi:TrmH family RNA methyltransferase